MERISRDKGYAIIAAAALAAVAFMWAPRAGAQDDQYPDITEYARECARKIAPVPSFDCTKGTEIPITVNQQPPHSYQPHMNCDRPSLLNMGTTDGNCVPYSRVVVLRDDDVAQIVALCREKKIRDAKTVLYDEIDITSHNVRTGSTCWFQAEILGVLDPARGLNGKKVPSPEDPAAKNFWIEPVVVSKGKCGYCHDSDPFMYSPFIAQTGQLPADPFGKYVNDIGAPFREWQQPSAISTRGNTCVGCHRIGNLMTCKQTVRQAVGEPSPGSDEWAKTYPNSHWMPPGNSLTQKQWDQIYGESVKAILACCANPKAPECNVTPIHDAQPQK